MMPSLPWPIGRFFLIIGIIIVNLFVNQTNCSANVIPLSAPFVYPSLVISSNQKETTQAPHRRALIPPFIDNYASIESLLILPDWQGAVQMSRPPPTDPPSILAQNIAQSDQFHVLYAPTSAYDASWFRLAKEDLPLLDPAIHLAHATKLIFQTPDQNFMIWPSQAWAISEQITLSRTVTGLARLQDVLYPATAEVTLDIFDRAGDIKLFTELPHKMVTHHISYQMHELADTGFVTQQAFAVSQSGAMPIQLLLGMTSPPDSVVFIIFHNLQDIMGKDDLQAGILSNLPPSILDPITLFH